MFPQIELKLSCGSSTELKSCFIDGSLDIVVLEEPYTVNVSDCLLVDRLVWVGMRGGNAHLRNPLPISLVSDTCCFRPVILSELRRAERDVKIVFENAGLEASLAVVRMDMAISAWLASTVPSDLSIIDMEAGLPELPSYAVSTQYATSPSKRATAEAARQIRDTFARMQSRHPST